MKTLDRTLASLSVLWLAPAAALAAPQGALIAAGHEDEAARAREHIEDLMEEHQIPGMSASVWMGGAGGEIVWSEPFGFASLELNVPVTRDTRFRLASVSKLFTAAVGARLASEGVVDLDEDVRTYSPEFPDKDAVITIRQLLGHLAGIRHYLPSDFDMSQPGGMIDLRLYDATPDALALFAGDPLVGEPGEQYAYSTFGYTLISSALENATDTPFLELIDEHVTGPLRLDSVMGDQIFQVVPNRTDFHHHWEPGVIGLAPPGNAAYKWAGGGLLGNTDDLVRFGAAHLEPGFIDEAMFEQMFTSQATNAGEETGVGLAWRIGEDSSGNTVWHHSGSMSGARSTLLVFPERGLAVSLVSNMTGTPEDLPRHARLIAWMFIGIEAEGSR